MFKKLLSSLTGKKERPSTQEEPQQAHAADAPEPGEEMIVAYDANGRQMHITRSDWRDKVFLPGLEQKWDDAAGLYDALLGGLNDGFAADLIPAAARLVEIDDDPERSHTIQGIVLMKNNQLDEAESTLKTGMAKVGATGILLTNLAKVFAERGDDARADELLWQAIEADPNQDNGLVWWATLKQEREGETGYVAGLKTVAALPGSWRAQLWLARHHLEHKNVAAAKALYEEVLAGGRYDSRSLMMISGDLGQNGEISLIVELIAPIYDEHRHDPMAGINLLRAYQELGNPEEGEKLLSRMYALDIPPLKQYLDEFAQVFFTGCEKKALRARPPIPDRWRSVPSLFHNRSGITVSIRPTGSLRENRQRPTRSDSLRSAKLLLRPHPPSRSAKMMWGGLLVPFRCIWRKRPTTGRLLPPSVTSRLPPG